MFDKLGEAHPACRVHVEVVAFANEFLVHLVRKHATGAKAATKQRHELALELRAKVMNHFACALALIASDGRKLSHVRLGLNVEFVAICVPTRLRAYLTVPAKTR